MGNSQALIELVKPLGSWAGSMLLIHYIAPAHMIGGILIAFGLLTRWSVLAQIPILIGAVAVNFLGSMNVGNLLLSLAILLACLFFLFYGSGKHSADYYFKMQK